MGYTAVWVDRAFSLCQRRQGMALPVPMFTCIPRYLVGCSQTGALIISDGGVGR